ncbi:MAG: AIPR family protein [Gammaproteobacteria bacterium]|nr:AIPR family protein [Gammaproteobacteria bacterium]MBU2056593.1 AIPR family protein [Gammaproteobacteria bacterium]MBU2173610.1 AIPR family protein [Gammaproteobacteria bacterium]MBU2247391.1 AIPR family protein [Gammaproteobacteria bacterium]MBU2428394.1 AIPR family protein [Gammaproteobacteria bacterium]
MIELIEFHRELIADIQGDADVQGLITTEAFFEKVTDLLTETGEIDEANRAYYEGSFGRYALKVDGYAGDPVENANILTLIICDFAVGNEVRAVNKADVESFQKKLYRFLEASLNANFRNSLEESSNGFSLAQMISVRWQSIEKIKFIIATNASFNAYSDAEPLEPADDKPISLSVWDLKRLKQFVEQGQARADLVINFADDFGGSVPLLKASAGSNTLESYLAVIPGWQLANIYDKWGPRLLEANVRSFLQARGKVNKGIRDTIKDEPHMFFAYNNGLSATADSIELEKTEHGLALSHATNLQIVNGGQTTASLHAARKLFEQQLQEVHVQMKLTIVPNLLSEQVVPRISEYANSQNKVNAADFFANHPFHVRVEELSRKLLAPAGEFGYRETKWFYERARGQYADERARRTIAERKKFDAEFPKNQFFTKTDLAKIENTFSCLPYIVSLGAQKNFTAFAKNIGETWGKSGESFDELWFKRLIAKVVLFRAMEKLVSNADWYQGGYRANIVTFGIAKVVYDLSHIDKVIDFDLIWKNQTLPVPLSIALLEAGKIAQEVITAPPKGIQNASEWAKKETCWKWLLEKTTEYMLKPDKICISKELATSRAKDAKRSAELDQSVNAEIEVFNLGAELWRSALTWGTSKDLLSPKEKGILETCIAIPKKLPSAKQCAVALITLNKLKEMGFEV